MAPAAGTRVWLERRKWPDSPHYSTQGYVLGTDDLGVSLGTRPGNPMYRRDELSHVGEYAVVSCVPHDDWFLAHFLLGHSELDIYVDVAAPAVWSDRGVRMVDLDFDVIVWKDGRDVELVDEDEFEQHSVELAYPAQLVEDARRAASDIFRRRHLSASLLTSSGVELLPYGDDDHHRELQGRRCRVGRRPPTRREAAHQGRRPPRRRVLA